MLRWHVQQDGVAAIPRPSNPGRIEQNLAVFDFELTDDELAAISALKARHMRLVDSDRRREIRVFVSSTFDVCALLVDYAALRICFSDCASSRR